MGEGGHQAQARTHPGAGDAGRTQGPGHAQAQAAFLGVPALARPRVRRDDAVEDAASYGGVAEQCDRLQFEPEDVERAKELRKRARKLNLRARDYGLRGLETVHPDIEKRFRADAKTVARELTSKDLPLITGPRRPGVQPFRFPKTIPK